jgi:hypothetical protein
MKVRVQLEQRGLQRGQRRRAGRIESRSASSPKPETKEKQKQRNAILLRTSESGGGRVDPGGPDEPDSEASHPVTDLGGDRKFNRSGVEISRTIGK